MTSEDVKKTHWVEMVLIDTTEEEQVPGEIEAAYQRLNKKALEGGYVIVSTVQFCNAAPCVEPNMFGYGNMRLCYLIVAQVILRAELEAQQRLSMLRPVPPGLSH